MKKSPFNVIKFRYFTEKARVLEGLQHSTSNASVRKCQSPKYVFVVSNDANKYEIAKAFEEIYAEKKIKVVSVNTINVKGKKRQIRGHTGYTPAIKKAVITLEPGDSIDEQV